jgi:hypothetical protein
MATRCEPLLQTWRLSPNPGGKDLGELQATKTDGAAWSETDVGRDVSVGNKGVFW